MLRHINLKNFKAWRELDIKLGSRITGLFGTNSSGKSSLIQFLLMLKETKNNPDRNLVLDFGETGGLINLGGFGDVIHRNDKIANWNGDCVLGWHEEEVRIRDPTLTEAKMNFWFDSKKFPYNLWWAWRIAEESKVFKTQSIQLHHQRRQDRRDDFRY